MNALEAMAKAAWENPTETVEPYDELDDGIKRFIISDMRAALLALAEMDLSMDMLDDVDLAQGMSVEPYGITKQNFSAICRALAEQP